MLFILDFQGLSRLGSGGVGQSILGGPRAKLRPYNQLAPPNGIRKYLYTGIGTSKGKCAFWVQHHTLRKQKKRLTKPYHWLLTYIIVTPDGHINIQPILTRVLFLARTTKELFIKIGIAWNSI